MGWRDRKDVKWGRIPPDRRGVWGRFLYLQRWDHGDPPGEMTQVEVRQLLKGTGSPLSGAYYSDFETGNAVPNDEWQGVFKRLWNAEPEVDEEPAPVGDLADLVAALRAQTDVITRLLDARASEDRDAIADIVERRLEPLRKESQGLRTELERLRGLVEGPAGVEPSPEPAARRARPETVRAGK